MVFWRQSVLIALTFFIFACLFAPQPVLPYLAQYFQSDPVITSMLVTRIMLVLAFGAVLSGLFFRSVTPRTLLVLCVPLLALGEFLFSLTSDINEALWIKTMEGATLSIMMPALMTALANTSGKSGDAVVFFVTASVSGSVFGRILSGNLIGQGNHSMVWLLLSLGLLLTVPGLFFLGKKSSNNKPVRLAATLGELLPKKALWACCFLIFAGILSLASVLNYLPFHMLAQYPDMSTDEIAWLYWGYVFAIFTSLSTVKVRRYFDSDQAVFLICLAGLLIGLMLLFIGSYWYSMIAVGLLCGSVFMLHSGLSAYLNRLMPEHRLVVNGLYLTAYYLGGATSSRLPGYVFMEFGWFNLLTALLLLLAMAWCSLKWAVKG